MHTPYQLINVTFHMSVLSQITVLPHYYLEFLSLLLTLHQPNACVLYKSVCSRSLAHRPPLSYAQP